MTEWLGQFAGALSAVFFVVDPFAVAPLFVAMTPRDSDQRRAAMARKAALVAGCVLAAFTLGGQLVFQLFGVTLPAFKVAGGILLLLTSLDQLRSKESTTRTSGEEIAEGAAKDDVAIVPIGMPLLAGPGSIATVMVLAGDAKGWAEVGAVLAAVAVTAVACWGVLSMASAVNRVMGATGRAVLLRVTGLLLAAVAVQFMISGVTEAFPFLLGSK